jgi:tetratricopeptide (TPR) repeat protein
MSPEQLDGAAPAPADDIYAFGALTYDLIAGQALFHPDVTPGRIRAERPTLPAQDLSGARLPDSLRRLLGSLLEKSPARRPPSMAAVRSALEEILREVEQTDAVIRPAARVRGDAGAPPAAGLPRAQPRGRGLPAAFVYGAFALCIALAAAVVWYLPSLVRERGPLVAADSTPPQSGAAPPAAAAPGPEPPVPQDVLDETLGRFLEADDALRKRNAERWGGADWTELRRLAAAGDAAYQRRDTRSAHASYGAAEERARALLARAPELLATALREGDAALAAGDRARAVAQFDTALAIATEDRAARRGLERARQLDRVLALVEQASAAEGAGARAEALRLFREAATLDPAWPAAAAGVARLGAAVARDAYETQMARGFAAQAARDLAGARAAFELALRARPGDAQATAALAQVALDQNLDRLAGLQAEALEFERAERWADAVRGYEAVLALDANLVDAKAGLERARTRAELDGRLRRELGSADSFNEDTAVARARTALEAARAVPEPGPVLRRQIEELDALLATAVTPVHVTLESDNATEVTLFKVGRLGTFAQKTLELRPGAYTALGSRPGYRDVRRQFRVAPGSAAVPIVVRCEEPI